MKNILLCIGVAIIAIATLVGQFTGIDSALWIELAGFAVGLAVCIVKIVKGTEKKDWKVFAAISGIVIGTICCVFAGLTEAQITSLISAIAGISVMVVGLLPTLLIKKESKD